MIGQRAKLEEESFGLDPRKICVLHLPHASRLIPADERARLVISDAELEAELLRMTDAFTDELFPSTPQEFARIVFPVSRLVCDVERFSDDADEPMAARGMGAVYTANSTGSRLRAALSPAERERIMARWYRPHHAMLTSATDQVLAREGRCLIVDCHSFSARPLPHEPDQDPKRPDICVGTAFHTPAGLALALARAAREVGLTVEVNRPFAGALVPAKHYRVDDRVMSLMIEVNRRLYMNEVTGERLISFESVKEAVGNLLAIAMAFLREG
jgi:N-formylglutamate deformylase